jgi:protein-L-isoaspartate(D-aspartate) O-methyltransferase
MKAAAYKRARQPSRFPKAIPMPDPYYTARFNMIEAQVRANDVTDPRIQAALEAVPREKFVASSQRALAYADVPPPIAPGRFLLDPRSFAKALQLLSVGPEDKVLDVGSGTGYSAAVLARLGGRVIALEQDADLVRTASQILPQIDAGRVVLTQGSLIEGFKSEAPYDAILINGAVETEPGELLAQLAEGGRLVAFRQSGPVGQATLYVKERGKVGGRPDFDATVPLLAGFKKRLGFVF